MIRKQDGSPLLQERRAAIMGILNATPDSFSDGGLFHSLGNAVDHIAQMLEDGADIIDIGGESTRPGAASVSEDEELERVIPLIEAVAGRFDVTVSIDTSKARVMYEAITAGAAMINDIWALRRPGALEAAASLGVPVCLMHMQGEPGTMQDDPSYADVTVDVHDFLAGRTAACIEAGIERSNIIIDPGFGFGKTREQNFTLLNELERVRVEHLPVLAGLSRKSMIGQTLGLDVNDRINASIGLALLAVRNGANIVRVHDVKQTCDALRMVEAVENSARDI
jgi:dihydropteroate synthase